jgi:hypothetical protein
MTSIETRPGDEETPLLSAVSKAHEESDAAIPQRSRINIGNILLVLASTMLVLVCAELILRSFPRLQVQTGEGEYRYCTAIHDRHRPHAAYGYTEYPGNSYFERYSTVDPWAYVRINAEGFRDNYGTNGRPVLVLGDSMTRGSLVNENETYTDLMDSWHPEWSFRNYGVGGYGQANTVRLYEEKAPSLRHDLVIQQYSLSTDLDDNVERATLSGGTVKINIKPAAGTPSDSVKPLVRLHLFFWNYSKVYPWLYNVAIRPYFGNWDARRNIDDAIEVTRRLFAKLANEAKSQGADLLVLVLPSWAEMAGRDDGMDPKAQRAMLKAFAAATPSVYLLDMTPVLAAEDPDRTYGIVDKHLTPYGHFIVAQALERWMVSEWPRGPRTTVTAMPTRSFHPSTPIVPKCKLAEGYLDLVKAPHAQ